MDHPVDVEVYPNERFASERPFPKFKVIASRGAHLPVGVWDEHSHDLLPLLREADHKFVTDFPLAPYAGFAAMHWIELDLGDWDASKPLRLLLDGFTDYFSASSMYAAWQAGITPVPPYIEALDDSGKWVRVVDDMGFPAGLRAPWSPTSPENCRRERDPSASSRTCESIGTAFAWTIRPRTFPTSSPKFRSQGESAFPRLSARRRRQSQK